MCFPLDSKARRDEYPKYYRAGYKSDPEELLIKDGETFDRQINNIPSVPHFDVLSDKSFQESIASGDMFAVNSSKTKSKFRVERVKFSHRIAMKPQLKAGPKTKKNFF